MNLWRLVPWKPIVRRLSRRHGFADPLELFERIRNFAQPSEVGEPVELLRAGAAFHARGLVNRAIQFNLDWVWPYWVERQFNPADESFVPRAFSFSHVNLTHRNWTAVGIPGVENYPIVDPRGLLTPLLDSWSLDFWVVDAKGAPLLLPSREKRCDQTLEVGDQLSVVTRVTVPGVAIEVTARMECGAGKCSCVAVVSATAPAEARLVVAVRPYNPEGISFIDTIAASDDLRTLHINGRDSVQFGATPERIITSSYRSGDVLAAIKLGEPSLKIECASGMATAAVVFAADQRVELKVPLASAASLQPVEDLIIPRTAQALPSWRDELAVCARLRIPNERWQRLYEVALSTLILHSPHEVYPGPYTYRRFWYRDAAFILHALDCVGAHERCRRALDLFPRGQLADGYFRSQEGEWDSNGQVLWILDRHAALTGQQPATNWLDIIERGAEWISRKRMGEGSTHPGLLPAGFSAEHLGLNDFYFWDDFWGVAGLFAAARLLRQTRPAAADRFSAAGAEFLRTIEAAIGRSPAFVNTGAIAAAPDRRMDSGAVGSLVADYPLQLFGAGDPRVMKTAEWLIAHSFFGGGFFQNMIHSGINAYLTLHVAQVLLRSGDVRAHQLIDAVAMLASPTGQWPEAIHPRTFGGCMGDGQHVWAAAEWVMAMRSLFVREEGDVLVIAAGIPAAWVADEPIQFGPAATPYGPVSVEIRQAANRNISVHVSAAWRGAQPQIDVRLPGHNVISREGSRLVVAPA